MSIILFILILGVLIFVHELGHFLVAKKSGIRVDEFAVGFPPRIFSWIRNGTKYSLNWIPVGGYVKIFGENADEEALNPKNKDSFLNKSRWTQAAVLVAGVVFNILFAWLLFSISLMAGFPTSVTDENMGDISESFVVATNVLEDSPADIAGLRSGDQIVEMSRGEESLDLNQITVKSIQEFIASSEEELNVSVVRLDEMVELSIVPERGLIGGDKPAIGISMDRIGKLQLPFFKAIVQGFTMMGQMTKDIAVGIYSLFADMFTGNGSLKHIAGPVGIVSLVGNASHFGLSYLLGFTAFISINLAILNILPFPALDGGRLLIVLIEGVTRRRIKPVIVNSINTVGFLALILLMLMITINDVIRLF